MPKRKETSDPRRIDLVRKARAGLIPASDDIADERRARMNHTTRVIRIVKTYTGSVSRVSDDQAITSILADLRHYCNCRGLSFKRLDRAAYALFLDDPVGTG